MTVTVLRGGWAAAWDGSQHQVDACAELGADVKQASRELDVPVHVHTSQSLFEFNDCLQRFMGDHYPPHTGLKVDSPSWVERGIRLEIEVMAVVVEE